VEGAFMSNSNSKKIEVNSRVLLKRFSIYVDHCLENEVQDNYATTEEFVRDCLADFLRDEWDGESEEVTR
jgi:uncharacterized short protein YbdD (DUF466 family)